MNHYIGICHSRVVSKQVSFCKVDDIQYLRTRSKSDNFTCNTVRTDAFSQKSALIHRSGMQANVQAISPTASPCGKCNCAKWEAPATFLPHSHGTQCATLVPQCQIASKQGSHPLKVGCTNQTAVLRCTDAQLSEAADQSNHCESGCIVAAVANTGLTEQCLGGTALSTCLIRMAQAVKHTSAAAIAMISKLQVASCLVQKNPV